MFYLKYRVSQNLGGYSVNIYHATLTMQWLEEEKEGEDAGWKIGNIAL